MSNVIKLFDAQISNGNSVEQTLNNDSPGNFVTVEGTFDNAIITMQLKTSGGGWVPIDGGIITSAKAVFLLASGGGRTVRAVLSNAGASTSLTVEVGLR
jgi:hypothetical protein